MWGAWLQSYQAVRQTLALTPALPQEREIRPLFSGKAGVYVCRARFGTKARVAAIATVTAKRYSNRAALSLSWGRGPG